MATAGDDEENLNSGASLLNSKGDTGKSATGSSAGLVDIPCCGCLSVQFYQPYFDINSDDVKNRLLQALFYCKRGELFLTVVGDKPDAYGPVWIATTLVFVIAVSSHMSSVFSSWIGGRSGVFNFQNVVSAASLIYTYAAACPSLIWLLFRQLEAPLSLISAVCLYGYSLLIYIPAVLLCLIPNELITWISLLGASCASAMFLLRNLGPIIVTTARQQAALLLALVFLMQLTLMLSIKFMFFN